MIEVINSVTRNDALWNSDRLGGFIQWSLIKRAGLLLSVNSSRFHKANEVPDGVGSMLVKSWWIIQEVRICLCMENWSGKFQIDMNSVVPTTFLIGSKLVRVIYVCDLTLWKKWINLKLGREKVILTVSDPGKKNAKLSSSWVLIRKASNRRSGSLDWMMLKELNLGMNVTCWYATKPIRIFQR